MAQLFPGAVVLLSISTCVFANQSTAYTISLAAETALNFWTSSSANYLFAFMISMGLGMAIHGLNWSIIGFMETAYDPDDKDLGIYESFWHDKRIIYQIILAPIKMVIEIADFLWKGKAIKNMLLRENVGDIPKDKWDAFIFVQNFYLYFAQFYAHTAYALLITLSCIFWFSLFINGHWVHIATMAICYVLGGGSFIVSRIQYGSLFTAEYELAGKLDADGKKLHGKRRTK